MEMRSTTTQKDRSLSIIAADISRNWEKMSVHARPYVTAMASLNSLHDRYFAEDAHVIVRYFLSNAATWKGVEARRVKKELNDMLKKFDSEREDV